MSGWICGTALSNPRILLERFGVEPIYRLGLGLALLLLSHRRESHGATQVEPQWQGVCCEMNRYWHQVSAVMDRLVDP